MLHLLVAGVLATGSHAALHPSGANLFFETSDVKALISAYHDAPAAKMLRSEPFKKLKEVAKGFGWDIAAIASGLTPVADPKKPDDALWPWSGATHVSLSMSGIDGAHGSDAKSSTLCIADFIDSATAHQAFAAIQGSSVVTVTAHAEFALNGKPAPLVSLKTPLEDQLGECWCLESGDRLVVGFGLAKREDYAAALANHDGGLAPAWKASDPTALIGAGSGATIVELYADLDRLSALDRMTAALPSATLGQALVSTLLPFVGAKGRWRIQLRGDRIVTDSVYKRLGASRELDALYGSSALDSRGARRVPKEAVGTWITTWSPATAEHTLESMLVPTQTTGSKSAAAPEGTPTMSAGLGDSVAIFLLPFQSVNPPTPRIIVSLELKDPAKFQAGLDAWLARMHDIAPGVKVENKPYRKIPLFTFSDAKAKESTENESGGVAGIAGGLGSMVKPTLAILPDRVLLTISPTTARTEIKRLDEKEPALHPIADEGAFPKGAFEASTMDWAAFIGKVYDMARGFLPMMAQGLEKPVDFEALPTAAALFAPFHPSSSWSKRLEDGRIQAFSESSFGPETPLGLTAIALLSANRKEGINAGDRAVAPTPEVKPELALNGAAPDEKHARTLGALREVRTAIAVYKSQFGRVPETLDKLLAKTDAFPNGFLASGKIPLDAWDHALVYTPTADGAKYALHSIGPDGIDQQGVGDDVRLP